MVGNSSFVRNLILVGSFLLAQNIESQITNYVTNGGFETYLTCSSTSSNLSYLDPNVPGWDEIDNIQSAMWSNYCFGAVPFNFFYYNYPRTDSAYTGIDVLCLPCNPITTRINIRNQLKANLLPGKAYCVKFYVNLSEYTAYRIDAIGAYFGGSEIDTITKGHVPLTYLTPQINNPNGNIITDTVGWTMITGTFTAVGNEKYMIIGNFKSDSGTAKEINNPSQSSQQYSSCTIGVDDVSCIPIDLPAFAGNDTAANPGSTIYIGRQRDVGIDEACMWYKLPVIITPTTPAIDTAAGIWINVAQTSTYVVRQEICGIVKWDTVIVYASGVGIEEFNLSPDFMSLFPNPGNSFVTVRLKSNLDQPLEFNVFDLLGREVSVSITKKGDNEYRIDTSNLSAGIYSFYTGSLPYATRRFSIVH